MDKNNEKRETKRRKDGDDTSGDDSQLYSDEAEEISNSDYSEDTDLDLDCNTFKQIYPIHRSPLSGMMEI